MPGSNIQVDGARYIIYYCKINKLLFNSVVVLFARLVKEKKSLFFIIIVGHNSLFGCAVLFFYWFSTGDS